MLNLVDNKRYDPDWVAGLRNKPNSGSLSKVDGLPEKLYILKLVSDKMMLSIYSEDILINDTDELYCHSLH